MNEERLLKLIICTDSQSAIRALSAVPLKQKAELRCSVWNFLIQLADSFTVIALQFVGAYCERNEVVDGDANRAAAEHDPREGGIQYQAIKSTIKREMNKEWCNELDKGTHRSPVIEYLLLCAHLHRQLRSSQCHNELQQIVNLSL